METLWIRYKNVVDPQNVIIDIRDPRDKDDKKLSVGLYFANDSNHVYPILFDLKRRYSDPELQADTGILFYDAAKNAFMVGDEAKLKGTALKGNYMQFNDGDQSVYAEGRFDFGIKSPRVNMMSSGTAEHSATDSTFRFNLMMWLDIQLPAEIRSKLAKMLMNENAGSTIGSLKTGDNKMGIANLITDEKLAGKMIKTLESTGNIPSDGEFKTGFVFTDVDIAFNRIRKKFIATGSFNMPIYNGVVINKKYSTTIALEKRRSGDKIYLYIACDNGDWVYMEYSRNSIIIATNFEELAAAVTAESNKAADEQLIIRIGNEKTKDNFLKRNEADPDE
ncbi:MAG: hypothetical protein JNM67_12065 [Bacteroidetes bacterium]|nr:hypothetical protein [Bacteroidota bacterium]